MKRADKIMLAVGILVLAGCFVILYSFRNMKSKETDTVDWIFKSPKPIKTYEYFTLYNDHAYILVNSEGGSYKTGLITIELPDTIK